MGKKRRKMKTVIKIACASIVFTELNPIKNKTLNPKELQRIPKKGFSLSLNGGTEYNQAKTAPMRTNTNMCFENKNEMPPLRNKTTYEDIIVTLNGIRLSENKFRLFGLCLIITSKHSFKEYP